MRKQTVIAAILLAFTQGIFAATPQNLSMFPEAERLIYGRLVQAFRKNDLQILEKQRKQLEKNFPKSVYLDNAYYLSGMLEFQKGRIGESIKYFDVVTNQYRHSNKRPAALFGKGVAYDRLNLKPLALRAWQMVIKQYPGSPEAQRARMHIRMEKLSSEKR